MVITPPPEIRKIRKIRKTNTENTEFSVFSVIFSIFRNFPYFPYFPYIGRGDDHGWTLLAKGILKDWKTTAKAVCSMSVENRFRD